MYSEPQNVVKRILLHYTPLFKAYILTLNRELRLLLILPPKIHIYRYRTINTGGWDYFHVGGVNNALITKATG
jgi:hypothetical protein